MRPNTPEISPATPAPVAARSGATGAAWIGWLPLILLPASAFALRNTLQPWVWMWVLCLALFLGCKWATWWAAPPAAVRDSLAYLFLWPGMEAKRFLLGPSPEKPAATEWAQALFKTALGLALLFGVARLALPVHEFLAAWIGMAGMAIALHSGALHLVSCFMRTAGYDARPIMEAPLRARSLSDFWSNRWNRGFSDLARSIVVAPLRRAGAGVVLFAVFLFSGVIHELVISVPARGGWGLPTAYFVLQGAAVALERSRMGKRLGLDRGYTGRLFAWAVIAGPAFFLFHPPFVRGVMIPMLRAAGAI